MKSLLLLLTLLGGSISHAAYYSNMATDCSITENRSDGQSDAIDFYQGLTTEKNTFVVSIPDTELSARITRLAPNSGWNTVKVEVIDKAGAVIKSSDFQSSVASVGVDGLKGKLKSVGVSCALDIYKKP